MSNHTIAFRTTRTLVAALGGVLLLPGLPLLACGIYGAYLLIAPEPPLAPGAMPHNLGQGFDGMLLMILCGVPGFLLGLTGGFLVDRARRACRLDSDAPRGIADIVGVVFLAPATLLLATAFYGAWLMFSMFDKSQPALGRTLVVDCGIAGLILGGIGVILGDRVRRS